MNLVDKLSQSMTEFHYQPDDDLTFPAWFRRNEDLFKVDGASLDDATRVRESLHHQSMRNIVVTFCPNTQEIFLLRNP